MRAFVGLVVASSLVVVAASPAQARKTADKTDRSDKSDKRTAKRHRAEAGKRGKIKIDAGNGKTRAARITSLRGRERIEPRLLTGNGQSIGEPWAGRLQHATELPPGDGY